VHAKGDTVGYVALTSDGTWSFYGPSKQPLGYMNRDGDGPWRIVLLGDNDDGSLELREAHSYPNAVAVAFGLEAMPQLRSTVFKPAEEP